MPVKREHPLTTSDQRADPVPRTVRVQPALLGD
jgi:hypothetical protein